MAQQARPTRTWLAPEWACRPVCGSLCRSWLPVFWGDLIFLSERATGNNHGRNRSPSGLPLDLAVSGSEDCAPHLLEPR